MVFLLFIAVITAISATLLKPLSKTHRFALVFLVPIVSTVLFAVVAAWVDSPFYAGMAIRKGLLAIIMSGLVLNYVFLRKRGEKPSVGWIVVVSILFCGRLLIDYLAF